MESLTAHKESPGTGAFLILAVLLPLDGGRVSQELVRNRPLRANVNRSVTMSFSCKTTVDAFMDEYIRRYSERDVEGVTDICHAPFLAIREGVPIHLPDATRCGTTSPR